MTESSRSNAGAIASVEGRVTQRMGNDGVRIIDGDPFLLTVDEVATLLRTSPKAVYTMHERGKLPGVVRINRRLRFHRDTLLDWLRQKSTSSLER